MAKKSSFEDITGMWKRKKSVVVNGRTVKEESFYGQVQSEITLGPGDAIHLFETRARNRSNKQPQYHLKVLRAGSRAESGKE